MKDGTYTNDRTVKTEQIFATGLDSNQKILENYTKYLSPILLNRSLPESEKVRIILLYAMNKGGISEHELHALKHFGQLSENSLCLIRNFSGLGLDVLKSNVINNLKKSQRLGVAGGKLDTSLNFHEKGAG